MTIKVTGHQWYWSYEYPDKGGFAFDSNMVPEEEAEARASSRCSTSTTALVVPTNTNVRVLIAGTDVMHSWFVPSFGVQMYAIPGASTRPGSTSSRRASSTASATRSAASTTPSCRSPSRRCRRTKFDQWVADAKKKFAQGRRHARRRSPPPRRAKAPERKTIMATEHDATPVARRTTHHDGA